MSYIPYILLGVLCVALSVLFVVFNKKNGWQGIVVRGLAIFSFILFAMITSNLRGLNNAFTLFICLALSLLIVAEVVYASGEVVEKNRIIVNGSFFFASNILFALSVLSLAEFNLFALLGGSMLGLGIGLIVCAVKHEKAFYPVLMRIITFLSVGILLGFGIMSIMSSKHSICAIMVFVAGILMLVQKMTYSLAGEKKGVVYITNAIYMLSLALMTVSILFY